MRNQPAEIEIAWAAGLYTEGRIDLEELEFRIAAALRLPPVEHHPQPPQVFESDWSYQTARQRRRRVNDAA